MGSSKIKIWFKWVFFFIPTFLIIGAWSSKIHQGRIESGPHILDKLIQKRNTNPKILFHQKCMICHETEGKTPKTMLAPPFFQVKRRYLKASMDKNDFINTMAYWVTNPLEENALMPNAVAHFKVMPKLGYDIKEVQIITKYIYETQMPKPAWFDTHQAMHNKGIKH